MNFVPPEFLAQAQTLPLQGTNFHGTNSSMELLLWRWSTVVQISSALMIAVFFFVLSRSVRRIELRPWVRAWATNLVAMAITMIFWFVQPQDPNALRVLRFFYFSSKTMFVGLLLAGASNFVTRWSQTDIRRHVLWLIVIFSAVCAIVMDTIPLIGVTQCSVMAIVFGITTVVLLNHSKEHLGWLCAGFIARAILAAVEALFYADLLLTKPLFSSKLSAIFLSAHSSLDTGAEWVIALGCVLAVYDRIQKELTQSNKSLLEAQEELQRLADRDPLTSLANRRSLPGILRDVYATGATILFFDLDGFKEINDSHGHAAGDEYLKAFARELQHSFRPDDAVIRYAGDEFVVVAGGVTPGVAMERVDSLRKSLQDLAMSGPNIRFSVGHSYLSVEGDPEEALHAADEAMYREKNKRRNGAPALAGIVDRRL
jgi:diguanylate cyclase (GGDEF)-like protein